MFQLPPAPFLRDPITVPRKELIEHYRAQAARYRQLAERQKRSSIYEGLIGLARQCTAMADALAGAKHELSHDEMVRLLNDVLAEQKSTSTGTPEQSPSVVVVTPLELSLDQILQKVQRDIAEGSAVMKTAARN